MATIYDSLPADAREQYPLRYLQPKARAILERELPAGISDADLELIRQKVLPKLPRMTEVHRLAERVRAGSRGELGPVPDTVAPPTLAESGAKQYETLNPVQRAALQFSEGAASTLPTTAGVFGNPPRETGIPEPENFGMRLARAAGGVVGFGTQGAAVAAAGGAALPAQVASRVIPFAAAAIPAALQSGTWQERMVRAGVYGLAGQAAETVAGGVGSVAGRRVVGSALEKAGRPAAGIPLEAVEAPAAAAATRASGLAGVPVGAVTFGGLAPIAEAYGMRATGEPVEPPRLEDVLQGMAELGIVSAATHGVLSAAHGRTPAERASETQRLEVRPPDGEEPLPAPEVPEPGPAAPAPSVQGLDNRQRGIIYGKGIGKGLEGTVKNPYDHNRTTAQGYMDRVAENLAGIEKPTDIQLREAAAKARRETLGRKALLDASTEPAGGTPKLHALAIETSKKWTDQFGGKTVTLVSPDGKSAGAGTIVTILNFPYPGVEKPFRVFIKDPETGTLDAFQFRSQSEFADRIVAEKALPTRGPGGQQQRGISATDAQQVLGAEPNGGRESRPSGRLSAPGELSLEPRGVPKRGPTATEVAPKEQVETPAPQAPRAEEARATPVAPTEAEPRRPAPAAEVGAQPEVAAPPTPPRAPESARTTFAGEFERLIKRGAEAEDARVKAEETSGESAPPTFDAEARASTIRNRVREEAGQASLFGAPEAAKPERPAERPVAEPPAQRTPIETSSLRSMTHEQIAEAARAEREHERGAAVRVFGEDDAKRYEKLQRQANSSNTTLSDKASAEIARMESELSKEQERDLFGIGQKGLNAEDLRAAEATSSEHLPSAIREMTDSELGVDLARAFLVKHPRGEASDAIRMDRLMSEALSRGWTAERVQDLIAKSAEARRIEPEDAKILVRSTMKRLAKDRAPEAPSAERGGAPVAPERGAEGARSEQRTVRAASLEFNPKEFQNRKLRGGEVSEQRIQRMLRKGGGFNPSRIVESPPTVWTDTKGEIGEPGKTYVLSGHHRVYLAQHLWEQQPDGSYVARGKSQRSIPVVEFNGTLAEAREKARLSNLESEANTVLEKSDIAREMSDQGKTLDEIADTVTQGKKTEAQHLVNLSHIDAGLRDEYFGEQGLPLNIGGALGAFVKRYNVHPEHQRSWLRAIEKKEITTADALNARIEGYLKFLRASGQESMLSQLDMGPKAPTPAAAMAFLGSVFDQVGRAARRAKQGATNMNRLLKEGAAPDEINAAKVLHRKYSEELERAQKIQAQAEAKALAEINKATAEGRSVADALFEVKKWVDRTVKQTPDDWGGTVSMFGTGEIGRFLSRAIRRGVPRALARLSNKQGTLEVRYEDPQSGQVRARFRADEVLDDPFTDSVMARQMALVNASGLNEIFTPKLRVEYQAALARKAHVEALLTRELERAVGSDRAARYFAEYGTGEIQLGRALEGKDHTIPKEFRGVVGRIKALLDLVVEMETKAKLEIGEEPPNYRVDYGFPHLVEGERKSTIGRWYKEMEGRADHEIADAELAEAFNRFHERRAGFRRADGAMQAIIARIRAASNSIGMDPFLKKLTEHVRSAEVLEAGDTERARATAMKLAVKREHFREKGHIESRVDAGLRNLMFAKLTSGIQNGLSASELSRLSGRPMHEVKNLGVKVGAWLPQGVDADIPVNWKVIAKYPDGTPKYVGGAEGVALGTELPQPREWFRHAMSLSQDNFQRFTGQLSRNSEARFRHEAKVNAMIRRAEADPSTFLANLIKTKFSAAKIAGNLGAAAVNSMQTLITTLPEYGVRAYMDGLAGTAKGVWMSRARALIDAKETLGYLTRKEADDARAMLPLLRREQVYVEATGGTQSEVQRQSQRLNDVAQGRSPLMRAFIDTISGYGPFSMAEGINRSIAILAADSYARRVRGLERAAPEYFTDMYDAREKMIDAMFQKGSAEQFAAMGVIKDQFAYNALGQPAWMAGPFGKVMTLLATWPINYFHRYFVRTHLSGAGVVTRATVRGIANAVLRDALGKYEMKPSDYVRRGGGKPAANWYEQFLEDNGAGPYHRHAAAVFVRQMAVGSLMLGIAGYTGWNIAAAGVPPGLIAVLGLARMMFPNDEAMEEWYRTGLYGGAIDLGRGITDYSPAISALNDVHDDFVGAMLGGVRMMFVRGEVQIQRMIRENPEKFPPIAFKLFGVKKVEYGLTPAEKIRDNLRMALPSERKEKEEPAP